MYICIYRYVCTYKCRCMFVYVNVFFSRTQNMEDKRRDILCVHTLRVNLCVRVCVCAFCACTRPGCIYFCTHKPKKTGAEG